MACINKSVTKFGQTFPFYFHNFILGVEAGLTNTKFILFSIKMFFLSSFCLLTSCPLFAQKPTKFHLID